MRHTALASLACTFLASLPAQVPSGAPPLPIHPGAFRGVFLDDADATGTIWARGTTWKAGLAPGGVTLVPLFGPRAPRNHPLVLRLVEARAGGSVLPLAAGVPERAGPRRVVFDHGVVRERWDLGEDHVEQSFDLAASPGAGDILLRVAVETDLAAMSDGQRAVFTAPGLGAVEISDAVAIDAAGRRLALPLRCDAGHLELRVPAAWLAAASYPLTVDPLIRVISIAASASDSQFPQLAFDASNDVWLFVYHDVVSQSDFDIVSVRCDGAGTVLDTTFVDVSTAVTTLPAVANNNGANQFLIAWTERVGSTNRIRGRTRAPGSTAQGAAFDLTSGGPDGSVTLGGASAPGIDRYCLAFVRGNGLGSGTLLARTVSTSGVLSAEIAIEGSSICDAARPRISADCGASGFWLVVWQDMPPLRCGSPLVMFAAVSRTGTLAQGPRRLDNFGVADSVPSVAGNGDQFLAVWERRNSSDTDVMGAFVTRSGATFAVVGPALALSRLEPGVVATLSQSAPSVAFDGCRYAYAYVEASLVAQLRAATLVITPAGAAQFHEGHASLAVALASERNVELASRGEHGGGAVRYVACWDRLASGATTRDIAGAIYDGFNAFASPRTIATACPNSGAPGLAVSRALLGLPLTASVTGARGAPGILVGTAAATPVVLCTSVRGTCRLGLATILLAQAGAFSLPVPCVPSLMGARLAVQGVDLGSPLSGGCVPAVFGTPLTVTDTLEVVVQ